MFQKSVLSNISQDESLVALRWAEYQKYLDKIDFIKTVKEEKYQDGFLKDVFKNCLGYTLDTTNPDANNLEREKKNETNSKKAKKLKFADKLEERNFKQECQALFKNDKKIAQELKSQINKTDKEIDAMVYNLTYNEIKIVEGS